MFKIGDNIVCINNGDIFYITCSLKASLTINKIYKIINIVTIGDDSYVYVVNDMNKTCDYSTKRFISLKDNRKQKLEKIKYENKITEQIN